jgi:HAD superfamily hydrolase (TIGR01509 family)
LSAPAGSASASASRARSRPRSEPAEQTWICLDVGETLIDETRVWLLWAELLNVPAFTFLAAIGAWISRGQNHGSAFEMVGRPDWRRRMPEFHERYGAFQETDLYPDVRPALAAFRERGHRVAFLANQPASRGRELAALGIEADVSAMSDEIGLFKPDPAFFAHGLELMGNPDPANVVYVGDRLDNDVRPSLAAGMRAVWLRRGPWGVIGDEEGIPPGTALVVGSLAELAERLDQTWSAVP